MFDQQFISGEDIVKYQEWESLIALAVEALENVCTDKHWNNDILEFFIGYYSGLGKARNILGISFPKINPLKDKNEGEKMEIFNYDFVVCQGKLKFVG